MKVLIPQIGSQGQSVLPNVSIPDAAALEIRPATVQDVHGISALVNEFAYSKVMLPRGPQYLYEHIMDYNVVSVTDKDTGEDMVVACGSIHVLWEDLAEICSLAVHPDCQRSGLGTRFVEKLVQRSLLVGVRRIFVFTLAVKFFTACGFELMPREDIPPIVWAECSRCPKFYHCDEVGMIRVL